MTLPKSQFLGYRDARHVGKAVRQAERNLERHKNNRNWRAVAETAQGLVLLEGLQRQMEKKEYGDGK